MCAAQAVRHSARLAPHFLAVHRADLVRSLPQHRRFLGREARRPEQAALFLESCDFGVGQLRRILLGQAEHGRATALRGVSWPEASPGVPCPRLFRPRPHSGPARGPPRSSRAVSRNDCTVRCAASSTGTGAGRCRHGNSRNSCNARQRPGDGRVTGIPRPSVTIRPPPRLSPGRTSGFWPGRFPVRPRSLSGPAWPRPSRPQRATGPACRYNPHRHRRSTRGGAP